LNIVMNLVEVNGQPVAKLSDAFPVIARAFPVIPAQAGIQSVEAAAQRRNQSGSFGFPPPRE
jgi:nicotinic acid phosphoribosyltransferase